MSLVGGNKEHCREKLSMEDKEKMGNNNIENDIDNDGSNKSESNSKLELIAPIILLVAAGAIGGILWPVVGGVFLGMMTTARKKGDRKASKRNSIIACVIGAVGIAVNLFSVLLMAWNVI